MRFNIQRYTQPGAPVTCSNCAHTFTGKICNLCGEKVFHESQLSTRHFFHQIVDFFTHFESKVLKTIWLNIKKPGFITQQNLAGIRVPYAKPVQLYLITALVFYFAVSAVTLKDYTPSLGDQHYYSLSDYPAFTWAAPFDKAVNSGIDRLSSHKYAKVKEHVQHINTSRYGLSQGRLYNTDSNDTVAVSQQQIAAMLSLQASVYFESKFNSKISGYSKTLIFFMIPLIALLFYGIFYRRLKYYGAGLLLASHFMVFNLCYYVVYQCLLGKGAASVFGYRFGYLPGWPFKLIEDTPYIGGAVLFLFGNGFEFSHIVFWGIWLYLAFRRLFALPWWQNLLAAYACSKVIFFLIFGVLKKIMIAFTLWTM